MASSTNCAELRHGVTMETSGASGSHILSVQASRHTDVRGPLDDGAAVWKYSQLVWIERHTQSEFVGAHRRHCAQAPRELVQIQRAGALVDLYRVAAAEADRGTASIQVRELAPDTGRTIRVASRRVNLADLTGPDIRRGQETVYPTGATRQDLKRVARLKRSDRRGHRPQHACRLTSGLGALRRLRVNALQTRRDSRNDRQLEPVAANRRAVNPGDPPVDGSIVDQVARLEVIGSIENQVDAFEKLRGIRGREIRDHRLESAARVPPRQPAGSGHGLGQAFGGIRFIEKELALQVAPLHEIAIDQA